MVKKENQRIALTKRMLQEGLLKLLETKDLDKISVTELCRASGVNRATFYNHYSSPQDLLTDLEMQMSDALTEIIGDPRTLEEISRRTEAACAYLQEHAHYVITLYRCHSDGDLETIFSELNRNFRNESLRLKKKTSMDADSIHLVSTFLCTGCYHLIREWLIKDIKKTPKEISNLLLNIVSTELL